MHPDPNFEKPVIGVCSKIGVLSGFPGVMTAYDNQC